ncbi:alpha-ketoglutarate-dependent dioxygenase AlkB [Sphingomonas sp. R647]|uniref:alpha-ketoglutarate-dependent dioxygenase AlkB n=1 Tax=Sphingomonas sp. R647 TaxID=2875233 RepID=UPI001CD704B6|nr:alpha-ketoglutarate-dependent dioxygenase AlkB [Sphingomonas sp. R647]MCA1200186.1 alpha-ketoglutarate-dependent dioxygenase AlkB [Sphingomonas sp. R647]
MTLQADLFGGPAIAGFRSDDAVISAAEEADLIAGIDGVDLSPFRFQGWLGKRLTQSFGWAYDFDKGSLRETKAIPDWLQPIRARAELFAGLGPDTLVQALLLRYDPGAGIGWHKDRPVFEDVVGISLGHAATMRFRRRNGKTFERIAVPLAPRSIYHLSGEVRHSWEHSIAPLEVTRWSITFRSLAAR